MLWVRENAKAVRLSNGQLIVLIACEDITERKRTEEELHRAQTELAHATRLNTLGELTASIAHEVNQPLAGVVSDGCACLNWLKSQPPNIEEARLAVECIIMSADRAAEVVQRIRALAQKTVVQMAPLDINDVIEDVIPLVRHEVLVHSVSLRLELAAALPRVLGDRVQLQQVIMNLLMNGIQAMRSVTDRPRELLIRSREHGSNQILIAVEDSGTGIEPQNVDRLFDAFFTTKPDGMGIGLSICRSIINQHGGGMGHSEFRGGQHVSIYIGHASRDGVVTISIAAQRGDIEHEHDDFQVKRRTRGGRNHVRAPLFLRSRRRPRAVRKPRRHRFENDHQRRPKTAGRLSGRQCCRPIQFKPRAPTAWRMCFAKTSKPRLIPPTTAICLSTPRCNSGGLRKSISLGAATASCRND